MSALITIASRWFDATITVDSPEVVVGQHGAKVAEESVNELKQPYAHDESTSTEVDAITSCGIMREGKHIASVLDLLPLEEELALAPNTCMS